MRRHTLTISAGQFDPVIRGLLLFGWLFPWRRLRVPFPEEVAKLPGPAFLSDSQLLAYRKYEEVEYLSAGALGQSLPAPLFHGSMSYRAQPNPAVVAELRKMQGLLGRAVGPPDDIGDYRRLDLRLQAVDAVAAYELDNLLTR